MFKFYYLIPLLIPAALVKGDISMGLFHRLERWLGCIAANRARAVAITAMVSLAISVGLALRAGIPAPQVHDEFGYLLLGDTFAHGRLTNPTPPLWEHFETIHEIMQPTYTAKYPPAQGLALAVGERLGRPIFGVWITLALACAAMCWMFQAWMPRRWALAGGIMVALHPQIMEWSQNYWGGGVALFAGALVIGGFRRMLDEPRAGDAAWMGLGFGILANCRPYEGCVFGLLVMAALLIWLIRRRRMKWEALIRRIGLPMAGVLLLFAVEIGYYNWRVTGSALVMPYVVHERLYGIAPLFILGSPRSEPTYRHLAIQRLQEEYLAYYRAQRASPGALVKSTFLKAGLLAEEFLWSGLMVIALLGLPWALARDRRLWLALWIVVFFVVCELFCTWVFTHYAAPAAGLFFVMVLLSMRAVHTWRVGARRIGRNLTRGLAILFVISFFHVGAKMAADRQGQWYYRRQALLDELRAKPGKSLVIVEYGPDHNPNREWVYNEADIPDAKVIFARDVGPAKNRELLDYYRDRKAWVVHADAPENQLEPYPGS